MWNTSLVALPQNKSSESHNSILIVYHGKRKVTRSQSNKVNRCTPKPIPLYKHRESDSRHILFMAWLSVSPLSSSPSSLSSPSASLQLCVIAFAIFIILDIIFHLAAFGSLLQYFHHCYPQCSYHTHFWIFISAVTNGYGTLYRSCYNTSWMANISPIHSLYESCVSMKGEWVRHREEVMFITIPALLLVIYSNISPQCIYVPTT